MKILQLFGMHVVSVPINLQDLSIDPDDISKVITSRTKGIIICTPNNPTGKVYSRDELLAIGKIATENDVASLRTTAANDVESQSQSTPQHNAANQCH